VSRASRSEIKNCFSRILLSFSQWSCLIIPLSFFQDTRSTPIIVWMTWSMTSEG
jgi:hypothetical protein